MAVPCGLTDCRHLLDVPKKGAPPSASKRYLLLVWMSSVSKLRSLKRQLERHVTRPYENGPMGSPAVLNRGMVSH